MLDNWRRATRSLVTAALAVGFMSIFTTYASATDTFGGDPWTLTAKHSKKCLDVAWATQAENGDVVQSHCAGTANQTWKVYYFGNVHNLVLEAKHSQKCLDVKDSGFQHAADVVQRTCDWGFAHPDWGDSQVWEPYWIKTVVGIPYYILVNENSGKCLDVAWFTQADGGDVLQADCTGADNQLWDLYDLQYPHHGL